MKQMILVHMQYVLKLLQKSLEPFWTTEWLSKYVLLVDGSHSTSNALGGFETLKSELIVPHVLVLQQLRRHCMINSDVSAFEFRAVLLQQKKDSNLNE